MYPLGKAPNWQRLIDGIKACCEDPDMDVVVACHDKEERLVVHARGERFDGIAKVDAFQFLGIGFAYRIGDFRAFVNPHGVFWR